MLVQCMNWAIPGSFADSYLYNHYKGICTYPNKLPLCLHYHNCDELLLVRRGVINNHIGNEITHHEGPCIIFNRAGEAHITEGPPDHIYERYNIRYPRTLMEQYDIPLSKMNSFLCPISAEGDILFDYAELLGKEYLAHGRTKEEEQGKTHLLIALLTKTYEIAREHQIDCADEKLLYIRSVIQYLHRNYKQNITIPSLTQRFYIGRTKLSEDFRAYTGTTVSGYIARLRVDHAKELLLSGESVKDTAAAVGFEYESHFINVFRKTTGVTPLQFKRNAST